MEECGSDTRRPSSHSCSVTPDDPNKVVTRDNFMRLGAAECGTCEKIFSTVDARMRGLGGGDRTFEVNGKGSLCFLIRFSDGSVVCAAGFEGKLYFFDVKTGRSIDPLAAHKGAVHRVVAHPLTPLACSRRHASTAPSPWRTTDRVRLKIAHPSPAQGCALIHFDRTSSRRRRRADGSRFTSSVCRGWHSLQLEGAHGVHKVYGVEVEVLVPGKLMSVSDDKTARVWTIGPDGRLGRVRS